MPQRSGEPGFIDEGVDKAFFVGEMGEEPLESNRSLNMLELCVGSQIQLGHTARSNFSEEYIFPKACGFCQCHMPHTAV